MVKDFLIYFFGQGTEPEFKLFTFAHIAPIIIMIDAIIFRIRFFSLKIFTPKKTLTIVDNWNKDKA